MKVTRRQFLKTAVGAAVAAGLPTFPLAYARSQTKQGITLGASDESSEEGGAE